MSLHILRKDVAGIHAKNSPYTKNIKLMWARQGGSQIKTTLQDHSRKQFLCNLQSQRNISKMK